jgi:hypothetical protein
MWAYKKDYKKMRFFILSLLIFITSCSALPRVTHHQKGIDPTFKPYVKSYRQIIGINKYQNKFDNLSMNFKKLENGTVGRCWWLIDGGFEIEIDTDWWYQNIFDQKAREFLTYHELEHCIRYRMHTDRKYEIENIVDFFEEIGYYVGIIPKPGHLPDGCPASLMHSHVMDYSCRQRHYLYYIEEMQKWKN